MTLMEPIRIKIVVHPDTMSLDSIVLDVMNQHIGILFQKSVSPVHPTSHGILKLIHVHAVPNQEL